MLREREVTDIWPDAYENVYFQINVQKIRSYFRRQISKPHGTDGDYVPLRNYVHVIVFLARCVFSAEICKLPVFIDVFSQKLL